MSALGRAREDLHLPTIPALDGIRAVAVAAVLLYHSDIFWFPGGLLGVEVFFVLSGYLITSLLWTELGRSDRINIPKFWQRRARRLFPALFVMLAVVSTVWVIGLPHEVARMRGDVVAAATYTSNWYLIHGNHSYFISFARPSPFAHLWSLAIEEQFYLVWPPLLFVLWRLFKRPARIVPIILAGAAASTIALALLYRTGDPSRIYYGTDTRASGLLIGAALALLWRPFADGSWMVRVRPWILDAVTAGSTGVLVWAFMRFDDLSPSTYRPGLVIVGLATAALIGSVVHPDARLAKALGTRPMRWLGVRSYSIYIWYFPVFVLTRPGVDLNISIGAAFAVRVAATVTLAELSYRYVEQPVRRGALGRAWSRLRDRLAIPAERRRWAMRVTAVTAVMVLLVSGLAVAMVRAPEQPASASDASSAGNIDLPEQIGAVDLGLPGGPRSIVAIGDSVMSGARQALRDALGGHVRIDAVVGRQVKEGIARLELLKARGRIGDTVIIQLGNNGRFTAEQFDRIMNILQGVPNIVFVNVKVPRRWEAEVNRVLVAGVRRHPGVILVNWRHLFRTCRGRIFVPDATHLTFTGARCYARIIATAL